MTTLPIRPARTFARRPVRRPTPGSVALALASRLTLFALLQALVATLFALQGHENPWAASVRWWPVSIVGANLVNLALLRALLHREGRRWRDLLRIDRSRMGRDVLVTLGLLLVAGVLAMGPNLGLATLLWGDTAAPLGIFIQPLPLWAALLALVGFPVTIALSELPTYYGYVRPRLEVLGSSRWLAVGLASLMHSLQHAALPLVLDGRFLLWRSLMFLPFALFVGAALRWRPRLLPYLVVVHGLLDASVALMVLQVSLA